MRSRAIPVTDDNLPRPEWERWFAWYPIYVTAQIVHDERIMWRVWWEYVERKVTWHLGHDGHHKSVEYRLCDQKKVKR